MLLEQVADVNIVAELVRLKMPSVYAPFTSWTS